MQKKNHLGVILAILVFLSFSTFGIATIKSYGISWDEPVHFRRGQAYLWYFLTGKLDYSNMPQGYHRSIYQVEDIYHTGKHPKDLDMGHPPLSDIAASFTNYIFYQQLGIVGDIESYHLFEIFISAIGVAVIFLFASEAFGFTAGILSALFLATTPLFWAESHFNIKDPPETTFIILTIYFLWYALKRNKAKFVMISALFAGCALSVKFNILFILPVLALLVLYSGRLRIVSFLAYAVIPITVFLVSWPYLWGSPVQRIIQAFRYYETVGTITTYQQSYTFGPINTYPLLWILFTTAPIVLFFTLVGISRLRQLFSKHKIEIILLLLWLAITIGRVTFSRFSIYGGVRQIMEYIPAMAILAGIGGTYLLKRFKIFDLRLKASFLVVIFVILAIPLVRLHPNENTYFNFLIGGLRGAAAKSFPAAGNTFGNSYKQGVDWINKNAEQCARLALVQGATANIPSITLRSDISYNNQHFSGIQRHGEYLMEVEYVQEINSYHYVWEYAKKFLDPVYQVKVDGTAVLSIWKNDLAHTKSEYKKQESLYLTNATITQEQNAFTITFPKEILLSRLIMTFSNENCEIFPGSYLTTSVNGTNWVREGDAIPSEQVGRSANAASNSFEYYFAGKEAKFVKFISDNLSKCKTEVIQNQIFELL